MKTLKSLMTAEQALQSQGIHRTHWGIGFKAVVPQKKVPVTQDIQRQPVIVFWMDIQREHGECL